MNADDLSTIEERWRRRPLPLPPPALRARVLASASIGNRRQALARELLLWAAGLLLALHALAAQAWQTTPPVGSGAIAIAISWRQLATALPGSEALAPPLATLMDPEDLE